jgi:hypothetical protein
MGGEVGRGSFGEHGQTGLVEGAIGRAVPLLCLAGGRVRTGIPIRCYTLTWLLQSAAHSEVNGVLVRNSALHPVNQAQHSTGSAARDTLWQIHVRSGP